MEKVQLNNHKVADFSIYIKNARNLAFSILILRYQSTPSNYLRMRQNMITYSPNGFRVRLSSVIFFILSIIGFFIWSDSESLRALFGSLFVLFVGIYLLLKSFDQSKIFITTFPSEISDSKDFIEVLPETEKVDGLYVSYKLKNEDVFYSNWPYYKTKERSLYLFLPVLVVDNR